MILLAEMILAVDMAAATSETVGNVATINRALCERLVPRQFADECERAAAALALSRTGFVLVEINSSGAPQRMRSLVLRRLSGFADFQDALREEGVELDVKAWGVGG